MPSGTLTALADGLRAVDVEVALDVRPAGWPRPGDRSSDDFRAAVHACATELRTQWAESMPDVVHAVGYVAAVAAVREARGRVPVLGTFYQSGSWRDLEAWLVKQLDGLVVHSTEEQHQLRRAGVPRESVRVLPPAVQVGSLSARPSEPFGAVATDATGRVLDTLISSMPAWSGRLVVLEAESARRTAAVTRRAEQLGVLPRLEWRTSLSAGESVEQVAACDLVVAAGSARSGALVSQAASVGVASLAVDRAAHRDLVISRATGLLVPSEPSVSDLGEAVRLVLADPMMARGYGAAAQVRARATQAPEAVGSRLAAVYADVVAPEPATPPPVTEVEPQHRADRDRLVAEYLPLARQLAGRYAGRGQALDDLVQVACLGLVKAAERFDPEHGTGFPSYAIPTILGELRRHFRDHAWAVRVPRTLQETTLQVEKASERLAQRNGEATVEQVAEELGLSDWEVLKARQTSGEAFARTSLDHPIGEDGGGSVGDLVGEEDSSLESVDDRVAVRRALARLPEREREIILMRFFGERTQVEIAEQLGISQVHVSRTLTRTLAALRDHVLEEVPLPESWTARR
jgi:RNA polymerase sigma-B factor